MTAISTNNKPFTPQAIFVVESDPAFATPLQQELQGFGYLLQIFPEIHAPGNRLGENPCLILINCALLKDPVAERFKRIHEDCRKRGIPVLGYSTEDDPLRRLEQLQQGLDAVVAQSALLANPLYQVTRHARPHDLPPRAADLPAGIRQGIHLFNQRQFHPAHDAIEKVWLAEKNGVRLLYQGILQIGIAFYFIEKGNYAVALRMFACGKPKIQHFLPSFLGIDVDHLFRASSTAEKDLRRLGPQGIGQFKNFPVIQFIPA